MTGTPATEVIRRPSSAWEALLRGALGRCPRCGSGSLFRAWLKPAARCEACSLDLTPQQADDFPAYVTIFISGHLMAPVMISLVEWGGLPMWGLLVVALLIALGMMGALLQPSKGAIIAAQWWFGMHGFQRERPLPQPGTAEAGRDRA